MAKPKLEIRVGDRQKGHVDREWEWVALVGGNGETIMTTETYVAGHGNAKRAQGDIINAMREAMEEQGYTITGPDA